MGNNILNRNGKGKWHGYAELYYYGGGLSYKVFYDNNIRIDYCEEYHYSGVLEKYFYI